MAKSLEGDFGRPLQVGETKLAGEQGELTAEHLEISYLRACCLLPAEKLREVVLEPQSRYEPRRPGQSLVRPEFAPYVVGGQAILRANREVVVIREGEEIVLKGGIDGWQGDYQEATGVLLGVNKDGWQRARAGLVLLNRVSSLTETFLPRWQALPMEGQEGLKLQIQNIEAWHLPDKRFFEGEGLVVRV